MLAKWLLVIALAMPLQGCTTRTMVKPGATEEQIARDRNDCEESVSAQYGPTRQIPDAMFGFIKDIRKCLLAKGYEEREAP